ncbi:cysteine peptidase family C39 domain-containing protein [Planctomycetota bacterium]
MKGYKDMSSNKWVVIIVIFLVCYYGLESTAYAASQGIVVDESLMITENEVNCGIQCLYLICRLYNVPADINDLLNTIPNNNDGTSMLDLKKAAENLGFFCCGYETNFEELKQLQLPAIVHLKENHYMLLYSIKSEVVKLADPPSKLFEVGHKAFIDKWSGYVLTCTLPEKASEADNVKPSETGEAVYMQNPDWDMGECPSGNTYNHSFTQEMQQGYHHKA